MCKQVFCTSHVWDFQITCSHLKEFWFDPSHYHWKSWPISPALVCFIKRIKQQLNTDVWSNASRCASWSPNIFSCLNKWGLSSSHQLGTQTFIQIVKYKAKTPVTFSVGSCGIGFIICTVTFSASQTFDIVILMTKFITNTSNNHNINRIPCITCRSFSQVSGWIV